jgi:serine/threonine protein kinase
MSTQYNGRSLMVERCGTGGYIAPEITAKNSIVGPEIDMWAFGVMLYEMCTAYKPTKLFNYRYGKFFPIFLKLYLGSGPIPFRERDWRKHSKQIQSLI